MRKAVYVSSLLLFSLGLMIHSQAGAGSCRKAFTDPESFALAMTRGLLLGEGQEPLFELYKRNWFGTPLDIEGKTLSDVLRILEKHPELSKLPIRERILQFAIKERERPESFTRFLQAVRKSSGQLRNNLFQIEENWGFWAKILSFSEPEEGDNRPADENPRLSKKRTNGKSKQLFLEYLNGTPIDKNTREFIVDPSNNYREKVIVLYEALNAIREERLKKNQDVQSISQAMVDLVRTSGFGNRLYTELLRSKDPYENMKGMRNILSEMDTVAMELGFEGHFSALQSSLKVKHRVNWRDTLMEIERDIENQPYTTKNFRNLKLRSLSIQEAPFRSCLSGDCSSRSYFYKALDPNFLYFTLTDSHHQSSGHITVVLGEATNKKRESVKIGFVDKIQNIPNEMLLYMLEGIRLSLKEHGYKLGLPKEVGDSITGLSNEMMTAHYVDSEILPHLKTRLTNFKPHDNKYEFENGYSRAYSSLSALEFESGIKTDAFEIRPGELFPPEKADKSLNITSLFEPILSLERSEKEEDQIKFLNNLLLMKSVEETGFSDEYVRDLLYSRIRDPEASLKLRKLAFWTLIQFNEELHIGGKRPHNFNRIAFLESWLREFSEREQKLIIGEMSNWKNTEGAFYKRAFIEQISQEILFTSGANTLKALESKWSVLLDLNVEDRNGQTALMDAAWMGSTETVDLLLKWGADVNAKNRNGQPALMLAARVGNTEIVDLLLKKGADVNAQTRNGQTALMDAAWTGSTKTVDLLLKWGADVNAKDSYGRTALILAVRRGHTEKVDLLLKRGADVNAKDRDGLTALMDAAWMGSTKTVDLLLKWGADVNAKGWKGWTALMLAAERRHTETVDLLLKWGARKGLTALIFAAWEGFTKKVDLFLKRGADVNAEDSRP